MNGVLIYTERLTNRLTYIANLLLTDLLGLEITFTHDAGQFKAYSGPKFSYARAPLGDELFFACAPLLFEVGVRYQPINFSEHEELRGFYPVKEGSSVPFDMFASAFFLVTRYNEYLPAKMDKYSRYRASQSMNFRGGYMEEPMVNYYAMYIGRLLQKRYPVLVLKKSRFRYIPTFDIDIAYSYLGKGFKRNFGGLVKSLVLAEFRDIRNRLKVLSGTQRDPYDTYDFILNTCKQHNLSSIFFFLLGDESALDKNLDYDEPRYQRLIRRIADETEVGIHLSFKSHVSSKYMQREIERLEEITGQEVHRNRFHYLRFQIPNTYQRIAKLGITEDYSMGYGPHVGFRAGICTPYQFFNVKTDETLPLTIYPITFMDTTFTQYYRWDNDVVLNKIRELMESVHSCGGTMYGLWHNSSFTEEREWKGWREIFETVATEASVIMKREAGEI